MDIDEDLLDFQDLTIINGNQKESIIQEQSIIENRVDIQAIDSVDQNHSLEKELNLSTELIIPVEVQEEVTNIPQNSTSEEGAVSQEKAEILINEPDVSQHTLTPEYVAEVKTELSEGRRAGFRFFLQRKSKIIAGVSFVLISSIALIFSGSFLSTDIQKA